MIFDSLTLYIKLQLKKLILTNLNVLVLKTIKDVKSIENKTNRRVGYVAINTEVIKMLNFIGTYSVGGIVTKKEMVLILKTYENFNKIKKE